MEGDNLYLKLNVVIEPLYDRWYAWSHLISPATAAMNVLDRHLKIMNSFVQAPHIHTSAVENPKMKGGPFMDLEESKVEGVRTLIQNTEHNQKDVIAFAKAIKDLDQLLQEQGKGYSLEPLYEEVPEILKGYVELVYDLNNHPSFRIIESLLYRSEFYNKKSQSIALWLTDNDERPFVLSTPRLDSEDVVHLNIPFDHAFIDKLSKMKREPGSLSSLKEMIDLTPEQETLFDSFFTHEPPVPYEPYDGDLIRMRYFGHACILIETKDVSILVDPLLSYYGYQTDVSRFSDMNLPDKIDYVLITHNHQDHILFETLLPLRHKIGTIVVPRSSNGAMQDPNLKLMFNNIGFNNVVEIGEMEDIRFHDCQMLGIPFFGEHSDLDIQSKLCYIVEIAGFSVLFVADSCNLENKLYEHVHRAVGDVDVLLLGMECDGAPLSWLYGPLLTNSLPRDMDNSRRLAGCNFERGKALVEIFNPEEVYVYAMGQEPWLEFISSIKYTDESNPIIASNNLLEHCNKSGRLAERLFGEKELLYNRKLVEDFA